MLNETYIHTQHTWDLLKSKESKRIPKRIYFCFIDCVKTFVWITTNSGKILKRWDHQTTWPVSWETCKQVKKQQLEPEMEPMDWFKIKKGCILSPCLFNSYVEYIMWKARLDESQSGIKITGRNINSLRCADDIDDTTPMAESEEELKSLLMRVKEESEKAGLKLNIQKMKILASSPITSWQIDGEKVETVIDFIFLGSKITVDGDYSHEIKGHLLLEGKLWQT